MSSSFRHQLVFTIKDKCRVCYTCVRECPVKAIRISNGQAEVIDERCIGCGNCVMVCSQDAKVFVRTTGEVNQLLKTHSKIVALVAPSFPAEFTDIEDYQELVAMIRKLGFSHVHEVAFGADLVAGEYKKRLEQDMPEGEISSDCPAIVYYVRHYHPQLVKNLTPIVSPMIAMTRVVRRLYGDDIPVVFIGPCIAKKAESREVDEVLTFRELREMFAEHGINRELVTPTDFDPPKGGRGAVFPLSRGLLQTAGVLEDFFTRNIVVASGRSNFKSAVKEFEGEFIKDHHLELLCCEGCIMGPGMSPFGQKYLRRKMVSKYVRAKLATNENEEHKSQISRFKSIDFSRVFSPADRRMTPPSDEQVLVRLREMGKADSKNQLNCGACGYDTCQEHAIAIIEGLAESEMCLPLAIERLHRLVSELNISNKQLATAKQALVQSEKLASMGQLSAGIAHELNNPLGVITMYSNILMDELPQEDPMRQDLDLIVEQAARCKKIVSGLLNFARKNQVNLSTVHMIEFVQRSMDSIIKPDNVKVFLKHHMKSPLAQIDMDQMMQVLTNLEKNAVEAMPSGGELHIQVEDTDEEIIINVSDTGSGISKENMDKIFTPFFTTKELGKGTGLGLPLIYGIVKMHKGQISVTSNADPAEGPLGTNFRITFPRNPNA
jgi:two-component system NtrC family sensor kinase